MKLYLIKIFILFQIIFFNNSYANDFNAKYKVSTSGIKIGHFDWSLVINENYYKTEIILNNSGFFSPLYKFEGRYVSQGVVVNNSFEALEYKQYWKTKKKIKIVEMEFDKKLVHIYQEPDEKELSRINLNDLFAYYDPITSFINILNGSPAAKTIDGRRVYIMERVSAKKSDDILIKIENYRNIWADHKRNDLKKIQFYMGKDSLLPKEMVIYFKDKVFKLKMI